MEIRQKEMEKLLRHKQEYGTTKKA